MWYLSSGWGHNFWGTWHASSTAGKMLVIHNFSTDSQFKSSELSLFNEVICHWDDERFRGVPLSCFIQTYLCPNSVPCFKPPPYPQHYPSPPPEHVHSLSHTEWLPLCVLTQTFPQKGDRKLFTPFYFLTSYPPPLTPTSDVVLG